jgi:hypothetical protein
MPEVDDTLIGQLRELLGERGVRSEPDDFLPEVILKPETTERPVPGADRWQDRPGQWPCQNRW